MITSALAAAALASTLVSPLSAAEANSSTTEPAAASSTIEYVPLVRQNIGLSYLLNVTQKCPASAIYVHRDVYRGTLPKDVTFAYSGTNPLVIEPDVATAIRGSVFNWFNIGNPYVSLDLKCTSDPNEGHPVD